MISYFTFFAVLTIVTIIVAALLLWQGGAIKEREGKIGELREEVKELKKCNNVLRTQTLTDPATGLWNRRYFDAVIDKEMERMKRLESDSLTLLALDIDDFKIVNDSFGHKSGDMLSVEVANLLKAIFRSSDYIFRMGGDEYAVLMRDAGEETVAAIAERICGEIQDITIEDKDVGSLIGISIGASSFDHNDPKKDMLHEADMKMYKIKENKKSASRLSA